jgi:translation initiation factor 1
MGKKNKNSRIIYSTNPDYEYEDDNEIIETLPPAKQKLTVRLDKKQRKGKQVTLVTGFIGSDEDLSQLAKTLKSKCGVGGSSKNSEIIIQGDFREKVMQLLLSLGYKAKVSG